MHNATPRHLRYASGYMELGMLDDAAFEIEAIAFEDRFAPPVLAVRVELYMAAKQWEIVVGVARELAAQCPTSERAWICWAYALRELQRIDEARAVLLKAEPMHGENSAVLHYNLACYYCLLGDLETARQRLSRACKIDPNLKDEALEDSDLVAVWHT